MSYTSKSGTTGIDAITLKRLVVEVSGSSAKQFEAEFRYSNSGTGANLGTVKVLSGMSKEASNKLSEFIEILEKEVGVQTIGDGELTKTGKQSVKSDTAESGSGLPKSLGG